jgi:hypothetical protein
LFSSLLLSWISWNHRFVFALLSSADAEKKFEYIDQTLYPTWIVISKVGVGYPILSALFLIFVFPYPSRWVYSYARNEQKKLKEIQQRIDDETPITHEEARALKAAIRKADADFEREMDAKNKLILKLREEIASLEATSEKPVNITSEKSEASPRQESIELDKRSMAILRQIASSTSGIERQQIVSGQNEQDRLMNQFSLDELLRHDFVRITPRGSVLSSAKGRAHIVLGGVNPLVKA